jgi:hypothetical protein
MQTQLETTRIHMATSERPMYTSESGSTGPEMGVLDTTFLFGRKFKMGIERKEIDPPVCEQHGDIHRCDGKYDVEPGILEGEGQGDAVAKEGKWVTLYRVPERSSSRPSPTSSSSSSDSSSSRAEAGMAL